MALKIDAVAVASSDLKKILSFYTLLGFDPDAVNPYWVTDGEMEIPLSHKQMALLVPRLKLIFRN
jgi:hypothetical protein